MGGWQDTPGELQTPVNYELYIVILVPMETFVCMDSSGFSNYVFTLVFCISSGSSAEFELQEGPLPEVTYL